MSHRHACPLCGTGNVPNRRALCNSCWPTVPVPIQRRVQEAWARRGRDPAAFREQLAALLQWGRDAKAVTSRGA